MNFKQYLAFLILLALLIFNAGYMWRISYFQLTTLFELKIAVEKLNNKSCE